MARKVRQLFPDEGDLDELVVEQIRVMFARNAANLRELEKYKVKRNICIRGITCTKQAVPGRGGGYGYGCAEHLAAAKAGIKMSKWTAYSSEYGRLRKKQKEAEKEEAVAESVRVARNEKVGKRVKGRRAA